MKASRKIAATPSLRERAAALSAKATQVLRPRSTAERAELDRRALLVGSLAGAAGLSLSAAAEPMRGPHPDRELFEAEAAFVAAEASAKAASDASAAATTAFHIARGRPPAELMMSPWEEQIFATLPYCPGIGLLPTHIMHRPCGLDGEWQAPRHAWTERGLQRVATRAVHVFGKGGRTPHLIRRWKGLLPVASAFDARRNRLVQEFRLVELSARRDAADREVRRAIERLDTLVAATVEGLAVKTRYVGLTSWRTMPGCWRTLLLSAAAVSGVEIAPRSDLEA